MEFGPYIDECDVWLTHLELDQQIYDAITGQLETKRLSLLLKCCVRTTASRKRASNRFL